MPMSRSAPDTVIEPFVQIIGQTKIGSDCRIRSYSVITNCQIGDKVLIRPGCIMEDSVVRDGAQLGPYSHLRPGSDIGEEAHVGNFVETKKTKLGKRSKANHLSYLGDAVIGEGVNIGAGTITCNYDGVNKHETVIEDGVFVGSDSTLVAPVKTGQGSVCRSRIVHHRRRACRCAGDRTRAAGEQAELGRRETRNKSIRSLTPARREHKS